MQRFSVATVVALAFAACSDSNVAGPSAREDGARPPVRISFTLTDYGISTVFVGGDAVFRALDGIPTKLVGYGYATYDWPAVLPTTASILAPSILLNDPPPPPPPPPPLTPSYYNWGRLNRINSSGTMVGFESYGAAAAREDARMVDAGGTVTALPTGVYEYSAATDLGPGVRPAVIVGYVAAASRIPARWDWDGSAYILTTLSGEPGQVNSVDVKAGLMVGTSDGSMATWSLADNALTLHGAGTLLDVNARGTVIGELLGVGYAGAPGSLSALSGGFVPAQINDRGYMVGNMGGTPVLRLVTGAYRRIPGAYVGTFITSDGYIGGGYTGSKVALWSFPQTPDTDRDRVPDGLDNCASVRNPDQQDDDGNEVGDICEAGSAPVISVAEAVTPGPREGRTIKFSAAASDPLGRPLTYDWDFGDGNTGTGRRPAHVFADEGTYSVSVDVSNGYDTETSTFDVIVANAIPSVLIATDVAPTANEQFSVIFTFGDTGVNDVVNWEIRLPGGTTESGTCGSNSCTVTRDVTLPNAGSYSAVGTATDNDGGTRRRVLQIVVQP